MSMDFMMFFFLDYHSYPITLRIQTLNDDILENPLQKSTLDPYPQLLRIKRYAFLEIEEIEHFVLGDGAESVNFDLHDRLRFHRTFFG